MMAGGSLGVGPIWARQPAQRPSAGVAEVVFIISVTDAVEAFRQHVQEEEADELMCLERHRLVGVGAVEPYKQGRATAAAPHTRNPAPDRC